MTMHTVRYTNKRITSLRRLKTVIGKIYSDYYREYSNGFDILFKCVAFGCTYYRLTQHSQRRRIESDVKHRYNI